jgi:ATP-dependent Lhr-like helicase
VLTQHAVTIALGSGFNADELFDEVRTTYSYQGLSRLEFDWILDFITTGGNALRAYPDYRRVRINEEGRYILDDKRLGRQHRLSIGTIVSDSSLVVQFLRGPRLGTIDEGFLAKIKPGDQFVFGGRLVELVRVYDSKVWVRLAKNPGNARIPRWMGGRMPLSTELAKAVRVKLDEASRGEFRGPEMLALRPLLELQETWSRIPRLGELLIERTKSREGHHLFLFPFAGRLVHEGLAAIFAFRMSQLSPITFGMSVNDYGLELVSRTQPPLEIALSEGLLSPLHVAEDIIGCMNGVEMGRRQFREIARIAGLVFEGYANQRKTGRQLQASTGLIYDVFRNYDPENLLLKQSHIEVLERQLEYSRLVGTLQSLEERTVALRDTKRFTPLSFPLMVDRLRERLSSETLAERVRRMQQALERAADNE